jgi:hypothetical protein
METQPRDRSLFWPIVLIGVGTIWLLANFNLIPELSWASVARLWPLALIAAGLDVLFGRSHPLISALIGLLTVGVAVALLVAGPRLGLAPAAPELVTERFSEPLEGATSADVTLDLDRYETTVSALEGATELIDAELTHSGRVNFEATGGAARRVRLDYQSTPSFLVFDFENEPAEWHIGLAPGVPLVLGVDSGSGNATLDLTALDLRELALNSGSGSVTVALPATAEAYAVQVEGGSGAQTIQVPIDAAGQLEYDGGSGSLRVEVANGAAVRVDVRDSGSGRVRVPSEWEEIESGDDDEGIWQTPAYDAAEDRQLLIVVNDLGSGEIVISDQ